VVGELFDGRDQIGTTGSFYPKQASSPLVDGHDLEAFWNGLDIGSTHVIGGTAARDGVTRIGHGICSVFGAFWNRRRHDLAPVQA
jgi:hypothetical protein